MKTASTQVLGQYSRTLPARVNQLKKSLVRRFTDEFSDRMPLALIRRAVDEADELAQSTGFPHLVLPLLAEETVRRVSDTAFNEELAGEAALAVA
jgi:hypothetical protein